jgi:hypothetical protein
MDADAVEAAGRALRERAGRISSLIAALDRSVQQLTSHWDGEDSRRLAQRDWPDARRALQRLRAEIEGLAQSALNNAAEQRGVSDAGGGAGSGRGAGSAIATNTTGVIHQFSGPDHRSELFWIDEVVGADGQHRFVVFINGTRGDPTDFKNYFQAHGWAWNLAASADQPTIAKIAIENAIAERVGKSGAEVMIIGYSQGGMIAQQIADDRQFRVSEVLTVASPPVLGEHGYGGANVTRLEHGGDEVVNGTAIGRGASAVLAMVAGGDPILTRNAITPLLTGDGSIFNGDGEVHTFHAGQDEPEMVHDVGSGHYDWLAQQYDVSTDPEIVAARERQAIFLQAVRV